MADANTTAVQKLYISYFSRPADAAGLTYWTGALSANPNALQEMSRQFSLSQEYVTTYAGMDNRAKVAEVYDNLFSRAAETAGIDYWANLLNNNQITVDNMVTQIAAGAQGNDRVAFNGKVAAADVFTARLDLPNEKTAYSGAAANKIALDWIAGIKDLMTGAAAQDIGVVDGVIARIVGSGTSGIDDAGFFV
ncbi:DUF4214 domain-containing protein [Telluria aromaticivorans]|uniref:DUF4214 domain-containing protein n=1 Tax=Telluria aromaticivorans TaxID=2725995 RepID=A0A7Y2NZC6_9BURK|nr:DUF4214 domain-containing protein [Telluria aromaticivorans]NNG22929.1 DUF4214 domain-containing protein [Telluria aromaticivorans]